MYKRKKKEKHVAKLRPILWSSEKLGYFKIIQRALQKDNIIPQFHNALQFFLTTFATPMYLAHKYCYERIKPDPVMFNACSFFPFSHNHSGYLTVYLTAHFTSRSGEKGV